jgi:hypothetical protein
MASRHRWHEPCTVLDMTRIRPSLRSTATFTESNFLRLHTGSGSGAEVPVTLEHFSSAPPVNGRPGWSCRTIVDGEKMTRADALFIAQRYAAENGIPVIYED